MFQEVRAAFHVQACRPASRRPSPRRRSAPPTAAKDIWKRGAGQRFGGAASEGTMTADQATQAERHSAVRAKQHGRSARSLPFAHVPLAPCDPAPRPARCRRAPPAGRSRRSTFLASMRTRPAAATTQRDGGSAARPHHQGPTYGTRCAARRSTGCGRGPKCRALALGDLSLCRRRSCSPVSEGRGAQRDFRSRQSGEDARA